MLPVRADEFRVSNKFLFLHILSSFQIRCWVAGIIDWLSNDIIVNSDSKGI